MFGLLFIQCISYGNSYGYDSIGTYCLESSGKNCIWICSSHTIVERNRNSLYLELWDSRPEDKIKRKSTILDRDVYEKESETDIFYRDKVFYSYGSAGFYTIYANPFRIKVYRNPSQPLEEKQEIDRSLAKYNNDEIQVISSLSDLTSEERQAYEKLRVKADNKKVDKYMPMERMSFNYLFLYLFLWRKQ